MALQVIISGVIQNIFEENSDLLLLACKQRAKFEGWLKFELAARLEKEHGFSDITLEDGYDSQGRSDLSFIYGGQKWFVELKTANTNFRADGLEKIHRPITRNISGIAADIQVLKAKAPPAHGLSIFCLFPIPLAVMEKDPQKLNRHLHSLEESCDFPRGYLPGLGRFYQLNQSFGISFFLAEV